MNTVANKPAQLLYNLFDRLEQLPHSFIALLARVSIGAVFWMSGQTKVSGFQLAEGTVALWVKPWRSPL